MSRCGLQSFLGPQCCTDLVDASACAHHRRLEACDEMHMAASAQQAIRDAKQLDATVVISDATLERLPDFLDGLPPSVHLMTKQQLRLRC